MFLLHPQLKADTFFVAKLQLCELRLMDDSRFPWLILVPQRANITAVHRLEESDQLALIRESSAVSNLLSAMTTPYRINIGALGNVVSQLHWHVVARSQSDACWPGPVWGCGERIPYAVQERDGLINRLQSELNRRPVQA
ncbi:MAG: HIT domain-containing protein [gamma proteobacterium endosymbiont of Lamellibrachia anaximandri]|nr:HIT domain-containing protein [gamma proteobacterium endosymbiont of Lamellibrachia anaximandri]MBL3618651.1 HIT domain-containing protein [gamma proteobacterium endosymbiont of Lamellibrachia anaximandri]